MALVRFALGVLIAMGVLVAALPTLVLIDLVSGGTGLGLCPTGLGTCSTSVYTVSELLGLLALAMAAIGGGIALCLRILRNRRIARTIGQGN
jgi:hypothetical protein